MQPILQSTNDGYILKAGTYVFGDPCYSFSHDTTTWQDFCKKANFDKKINDVQLVSTPYSQAVWCSTYYGDGRYSAWLSKDISEKSNCFLGVDAGLLGFVPIADVELDSTYSENKKCCQIITLKVDCIVENIDGHLTLTTVSDNDIVLSVNTKD